MVCSPTIADVVIDPPRNVTTDTIFHTVAFDDAGNAVLVTTGYSQTFALHSSNRGGHWSSRYFVERPVPNDKSDVDHQLATDGQGSWILVWDSQDLGSTRDVLYARSFDNGETWTDSLPLSAALTGPSAEPDIDTDGAGNWGVIWHCDPGVCFSRSDDDGANWSQPNEMDDDGDGLSECAGDCDDGNPDVWNTPGEVPGLLLAEDEHGDARILWSPPANPGGSGASLIYDVVRSGQRYQCAVTADQACVDENVSDTTTIDIELPPSGETFFYQVRAENSCPAIGPLTVDGDKTRRRAILCP